MPSTTAENDGMPSAGNASNDVGIKPVLSSREQEVLMASWLSMKGEEPQIDYEKLSKILGLKNAHSANTALYNVRKKVKKYRSLVDGANVVQSPTPTPKATPKATPRKRASAGHPETPKSGKAAKRVKSEASTPKELQPPAEDEQDGGI